MKYRKRQLIKHLSSAFDHDLHESLNLLLLPDQSIYFNEYVIKLLSNGNWGIYKHTRLGIIDEFFSRISGVIACDAHSKIDLARFQYIKQLDTRFWSMSYDVNVYSKKLNSIRSYDKYITAINRLEDSKIGMAIAEKSLIKLYKQVMLQNLTRTAETS